AGQRLQRFDPRTLPDDVHGTEHLPVTRGVPHPSRRERALCALPLRSVRRGIRRTHQGGHPNLLRVPAAAPSATRRMAVRDRRLPELALFAAAAVVHTWPRASAPQTWSRVDNADSP